MQEQKINRISGKVLITLSLITLLTILSGYALPPQEGEGAPAHIFQLSIVALVPVFVVFFVTADWKQPLRSARPLVITVVSLAVAFVALYHLEHYRTV